MEIYCEWCMDTDNKPMYCPDCEKARKEFKTNLDNEGFYTLYESGSRD